MDDGIVEIGTFRMLEDRKERKAMHEDAGGMPVGMYRVFALCAKGRVDPLHVSLARESEPGTWHVLDRVPVSRLVNTSRVSFNSGVAYDAQSERIALEESVLKIGFAQLRHAAEYLVCPGFSLIDRIGEAVRIASPDEAVEGTLVHWEGDRAIVQLSSGELVALSEERSEPLHGKGLDTLVRVDNSNAEAVSRGVEGAALSLEVFGG